MAGAILRSVRTAQVTANYKDQSMKKHKIHIPKNPLSKETYDHLKSKHKHMKGIEREKTIKRLHMYDRGFREKDFYKSDKKKLEYTKESDGHY